MLKPTSTIFFRAMLFALTSLALAGCSSKELPGQNTSHESYLPEPEPLNWEDRSYEQAQAELVGYFDWLNENKPGACTYLENRTASYSVFQGKAHPPKEVKATYADLLLSGEDFARFSTKCPELYKSVRDSLCTDVINDIHKRPYTVKPIKSLVCSDFLVALSNDMIAFESAPKDYEDAEANWYPYLRKGEPVILVPDRKLVVYPSEVDEVEFELLKPTKGEFAVDVYEMVIDYKRSADRFFDTKLYYGSADKLLANLEIIETMVEAAKEK